MLWEKVRVLLKAVKGTRMLFGFLVHTHAAAVVEGGSVALLCGLNASLS